MDASSEANAPCITEQHILTAAAFIHTPWSLCGTQSIRHAGDCITAEAVGKGIARAYSHHSVAGDMFSPMVLLGTPELTLPGMHPRSHPPPPFAPTPSPPCTPPHKMSCWLPQQPPVMTATACNRTIDLPDMAFRVYRVLFVGNCTERVLLCIMACALACYCESITTVL